MRTKLVMFGTGGFAEILESLISEQDLYDVVAFTVDQAMLGGKTFLNRPVIAFEEVEKHYPPDRHEMIIGVAYPKMNSIRRDRYLAAKEKGYQMASYFSPKLRPPTTVTFGEHNIILDDNALQPFCELKDNVVLWSSNIIGHHAVLHSHCFVTSGAGVSGHAQIGECCLLGVNCVVQQDLKIGDRCFVGPLALVTENLPPDSVVTASKATLRKFPSSRLPAF
jgi:sugar O-acyltransferase (sialic acid O-acetyltransferase NeuD family)